MIAYMYYTHLAFVRFEHSVCYIKSTMHVCVYICMYMYTMYVCAYVLVCRALYMYMYVCIHIFMFMCVCE